MTASRNIIVLDSNLIVSAFLNPKGAASEALKIGLEFFDLAASLETVEELLDVLTRDKFDKYLSKAERKQRADYYTQNTLFYHNLLSVNDCKDPKDNKFLSLALTAKARLIVSGDKKDLISMNPYHGVEIIGIRGRFRKRKIKHAKAQQYALSPYLTGSTSVTISLPLSLIA